MPKRIPVNTIMLHREGKPLVPDIGKVFDFTAEELADINAVNPDAVRKPVNEGTDESSEKTADKATETATAASSTKTKAKGATTGADAL